MVVIEMCDREGFARCKTEDFLCALYTLQGRGSGKLSERGILLNQGWICYVDLF